MALHVALLRVRGLPPEAQKRGRSSWLRGDAPSSATAGSGEPCHATLRLLPDGPKRASRAAEPRRDGELVRRAAQAPAKPRCALGQRHE